MVDSFLLNRVALWSSPVINVQVCFTRAPGLAQGFDIGGLNNRVFPLAGIAPGIARVSDDGSDLDVVQLVAEGRHGGARMTVQHSKDLLLHGADDDRSTVQRREGAWYALALSLVTGYAIGRIDFVAAGDQFFLGPFLVGIVGSRRQALCLLGSPFVVVLLGNHVNDDGHESVILAA